MIVIVSWVSTGGVRRWLGAGVCGVARRLSTSLPWAIKAACSMCNGPTKAKTFSDQTSLDYLTG